MVVIIVGCLVKHWDNFTFTLELDLGLIYIAQVVYGTEPSLTQIM
jgi:hypothetical protein